MKLNIGTTQISVSDQGVVIDFAGGDQVLGEPEDTEGYRDTAQRYGYGADTLALCIDHEIMHIAIGQWLGVESPTMNAIRGKRMGENFILRSLEESAVLALQQYARAAGVNLIRLFIT